MANASRRFREIQMVDYSGYPFIKFEQADRVMTVTFNRPDALNAMTAEMHEETSRIFTDLGMDHSIDVIILTGAGIST